MKEKLTELIKQAKYCTAEELADYLISAGLVLPTRCKNCRWRKGRGLCYMISGDGIGVGTGDDFYCQYGVAAEWKEKDNG